MRRRYYFFFLLVFTATLWTSSWLISQLLPPDKVPPLVFFQFGFFTILTGGIHLVLRKAAGDRPIRFVNTYMAASTFKLMITLGVILVIAWRSESSPAPFVIHFAILYLLYTFFEIAVILRMLRGK